MHWQSYTPPPTRAVKGNIGLGDRWAYLITQAPDGRFLLCRWPQAATELEMARQAAVTALEGATIGDCLDMAERFEAGHDLDHEAWKHPQAPGESVA